MLCDCVDYQQLTQLHARIDAINASVYAVLRVFLACFLPCFRVACEVALHVYSKKRLHGRNASHSVDLRQTLFPFSTGSAFSCFRIPCTSVWPIRSWNDLVARVNAYRVYQYTRYEMQKKHNKA